MWHDVDLNLAKALEQFAPLLNDPAVSEVCVNGRRSCFFLRAGDFQAWPEEVDERALEDTADVCATLSHEEFGTDHPMLTAALGGLRFQFIGPPVVSSLTMCIRKRSKHRLSLEDYRDSGAFDMVNQTRANSAAKEELANLHGKGDWMAFLRRCVQLRQNILVGGGTDSGKTTLLDTLLAEINENERLVSIEDARELDLNHRNWVPLCTSGRGGRVEVDERMLRKAAMRMRPDRIVFGELRGAEAFAWLEAIRSGHPGSLSTIHADTADDALDRVAMAAQEARSAMTFEQVRNYAAYAIDVVVCMQKIEGRYLLAEVMYPCEA